MKKVYFYFHAGSGNHGCEAIVRSTTALLNARPVLISSAPEQDLQYGIDAIAEVKAISPYSATFTEKLGVAFGSRVMKSEKRGYEVRAKHESLDFDENSIALSIGGDNYCYGLAYNQHLAGLNKSLHQRNIRTVLWGCSIEPATVTAEMKQDFAKYDMIVARESISYKLLKGCNPNTIQVCDPAFSLKTDCLPLPEGFILGKTIGINLSPLIQKNEKVPGITLENYRKMIQHIIESTDYHIALIPHVVCLGNDDREPLQKIYDEFKNTKRVVMIEDHNCEQLKGYISRCSMFIGARTHATIAAYSTCVPTLVIGYSTKATGIATDLFGTSDNYVLPVQNLREPDDMIKAFDWLAENQSDIKQQLQKILPSYMDGLQTVTERIRDL